MLLTSSDDSSIKLTVAYFMASSEEGGILFKMIKEALPHESYELYLFNGEDDTLTGILFDKLEKFLKDKFTPVELSNIRERVYGLFAVLSADICIFDGSIDDNGDYSQYRYAMPDMCYVENVLIVSRTRLPYNFEGLLIGGSLNWIQTRVMNNIDETESQQYGKSNEEIKDWILSVIKSGTLKLPQIDKVDIDLFLKDIKSSSEFMSKIKSLKLKLQNGYSKSLKNHKERNSSNVFVSFKSNHSVYYGTPYGNSIEHLLLSYINDHFIKEEVIYLPPGRTSNEIMTEQRRWELVYGIMRKMQLCKAVIIYESDDYWHSWWTTAELIALSYLFKTKSNCPFELHLVAPKKNSEGYCQLEAKKIYKNGLDKFFNEYKLDFDDKTVQKFVMIFSFIGYYHYCYGDNYLDSIYKFYTKLDEISKWFHKKLIRAWELNKIYNPKKALSPFDDKSRFLTCIDNMKNLKACYESIDFEKYLYSRDFWECLIVECPECRRRYYKWHTDDKYSIVQFMTYNKSFIERISLEESRKIKDLLRQDDFQYLLFLSCGHKVYLKKSFYLKYFEEFRCKEKLIEKIDIVYAENVKSNNTNE